jgi:hypothetical protein
MADRKTLIPEMLPDPKAGVSTRGRSLRERVLRHTQRLLKTSAIAGSAVLAGCSDTSVAAARKSDAGADSGFDAGADAGVDSGFDAGVDAGLPDAGDDAGYDAGYVVVDPMPPPANCSDDPISTVSATAALLSSGEVHVVLSDWMFASWQLTNQVHSLQGAQLVGVPEASGYGLSFFVQPDMGVSSVSAQIDVTCDDGSTHVRSTGFLDVSIELIASPGPDAGPTPLNVTVSAANLRDH